MCALNPIKFETSIDIDNVPVQWLQIIDFREPFYVHFKHGGDRVYGFNYSLSVKHPINKEDKLTSINFGFICNVDLDSNTEIKNLVKLELKKRIGIKDKISLQTLLRCCNSRNDYKSFIEDLWNKFVKKVYGNHIPYPVMDEMYSIIRFLTALASPSGRKSEMQMVYDFLSYYGEEVVLEKPWDHLEFYLVPTYDDMLSKDFVDFPKFASLMSSIDKFVKLFFTREVSFGGKKMNLLNGSLPSKDEDWRKLTSELLSTRKISKKDKENLDFLVDAFNRFPLRATCFIGTVYNINKNNDFRKWSKSDFIKVYTEVDTRGFSPKAAGCFLQQGFCNFDAIPIDIWVKTFYQNVLNIKDDEEFLKTFSEIGKLERLIWLVSQARKTNMKLFYDSLWCMKFGTPDNEIRGPNPLSCYECLLRSKCVGYKSVSDKNIFVQEGTQSPESNEDCTFVVGTQDSVPKLVFKKKGSKWILIDEYSGYIIHDKKTKLVGKKVKVEKFLQDMPSFR